MSVFKVQLQQPGEGYLDVNSLTGAPNTSSIQRTVYIMGPNRVNRLLVDQSSFTDSNYYKQFCQGIAPAGTGFLQLVSDDGSVYNAQEPNETYLVSNSLTIANGTTFTLTANQINYLSTNGSYAQWCQINNLSSGAVTVQMNGASTSTFTLAANSVQSFNVGDLNISLIAFANSSGNAVNVSVLAGVQVIYNT